MTTLSEIIKLIEAHDRRAGKRRSLLPFAWVTKLRALVARLLASNSNPDEPLSEDVKSAIIQILDAGGNPKIKNGELSASGELAESLYQLIDPESRKPIFNAYVLVNIIRHLRPEEIAQLFLLNKELFNELKNERLWQHATRNHFSFQYHQIKSSNPLPWLNVFKTFRASDYDKMSKRSKVLFSSAKSSDLETMIRLNLSKNDLLKKDKSGVSLVNHIALSQSQAARDYAFNAIIEPMFNQSECIEETRFSGYAYLHWTVILCQIDKLKALFDNAALIDINLLSANKRTPLQLAAYFGHTEIIQALINLGAKVNAAIYDLEVTPFSLTAQHGDVKSLELLINELDDEEISSNLKRVIFYPMKIASQQGHLDIIKLLLKKTKSLIDDPLNAARAAGNAAIQARLTPLHKSAKLYYRRIFHLAVQFGHDDIIREFLDRYPSFALDPAKSHGPSPLHIAASQGHAKVAKHLLLFKADLNASYNELTPLQVATMKGNNALVDLLRPKEEERVVNNPAHP